MISQFFYSNPFLAKIIFLLFSGFVIRQSLIVAGQRWANTYHHLATYVLLPCIAMVISSVIKNDIALSLGMIGALSIVRFRNPVKSPFELVMFFGLLTLGVVASADLSLAIKLFFVIVFVVLGIKFVDRVSKIFGLNIFEYSFGDGNLLFTLEIETSTEVKEFSKNKGLISSFISKDEKVFSYRIVFKNRDELNKFRDDFVQDKRVINIKSDLQS